MVLTMIGRYTSINLPDDQVSSVLELLGMTVSDMVQEGLIEEEKLDNCNMPCYLPTPEEVRHVIQEEGSFHITRFETFNVSWDAEMGDGDLRARGKYVAASMRAITEPILAVHFGEEVMDDLFERNTFQLLLRYVLGNYASCNAIHHAHYHCQPLPPPPPPIAALVAGRQ
ncbi:hypothetical protein BT93_D2081 [Corymbia citriodora subsp. variegata]|nr:hypothetical protein BT93_D2081 [Corymbia citriodora subsp. variegata]